MKRLRLGQHYVPSWNVVEDGVRGIFERAYFANNGPLVQDLDRVAAEATGVPYAVAVTNDMMAMMLAAKSLFRQGGVVIAPPFLSPQLREALVWGGYRVRMLDVDQITRQLDPDTVERSVDGETAGIVAVHVLGNVGNAAELEARAAALNVPLIFDASDAFGAATSGRLAGSFGDASLVSFGEADLLNAGEGACVTTRSLEVSNRVRTLRNFHPGQTFAQMPLRMNGKMAEAPAMLALAAFADVTERIAMNSRRFDTYRRALEAVESLTLLEPVDEQANYQRLVVELAPSVGTASHVARCLDPYGIEARPAVAATDAKLYPVAGAMFERLLELPNGADIRDEDVFEIAGRLKKIAAI